MSHCQEVAELLEPRAGAVWGELEGQQRMKVLDEEMPKAMAGLELEGSFTDGCLLCVAPTASGHSSKPFLHISPVITLFYGSGNRGTEG